MITEDYVSLAVSKLLREKGFEDDFCHTAYDCNGEFFWYGDYSKDRKGIMDAPTLQMAMKWLRDRYKLCVVVKPYITEEGIFYLFEIMEMNKDSVLNKKAKTGFDTYEEAGEAGIKYCLENLI